MFRQSLRLINRSAFNSVPRVNPLSFSSFRYYSTDSSESDGPKSIAVVLSGCGYLDGSEVTEATALMINLTKQSNWRLTYFAPTGDIEEVFDHSTRALERNELRNIISESTRISRDKVLPLDTLTPEGIDAVVFPGGYGAGRVLSNYSKTERGSEPLTVNPQVEKVIRSFHKAKKPMGFMCLSSVLPALVLGAKNGGPGVIVTTGDEEAVGKDISEWGNEVKQVPVDSVVIDDDNRIISTPAYLAKVATPYDIYLGAENLVTELSTLFSGKKKDDTSSGVNLGPLEQVFQETLGAEEWEKEKEQIFRRQIGGN